VRIRPKTVFISSLFSSTSTSHSEPRNYPTPSATHGEHHIILIPDAHKRTPHTSSTFELLFSLCARASLHVCVYFSFLHRCWPCVRSESKRAVVVGTKATAVGNKGYSFASKRLSNMAGSAPATTARQHQETTKKKGTALCEVVFLSHPPGSLSCFSTLSCRERPSRR
ncbi:unnamed protein product, partial [Scytosiphon promiscuus]